ncbi:acyltransferase domain-containing protein, partial [Micromonospora maritima]|uniref:acyltransferase domain-containing protein n=1 Tax=Micromonospora maritima TaxID=986711 RepID=UPI001FE64541
VSVATTAAEAIETIGRWDGRVALAAVNGPTSVVVSGDAAALDELVAHYESREVRVRRVPVDYASHSAHVEPLREHLLARLAAIEPRTGTVRFRSTVTGDWTDTAGLDADYWYRNLRETVRFDDAVRDLTAAGYRTFVEVSAHPVLTMAVQDSAEAAAGPDAVTVTGSLRRDEGGLDRFHRSLAALHTAGTAVDWRPAFAGHPGRLVDLPTYPFQRQHYWVPAGEPAAPATAAGLLALVGLFDIVGTVASGWLTDRVDSRLLLGAYYALRGVSLLVLPSLFADRAEPSMLVFIIFYGLDWVATVPPTVALCREWFGASGAVVFGWVFAAHQVGAALAATGAGLVRDRLGDYALAWYVAGALSIGAAGLSLLLRRRAAAE